MFPPSHSVNSFLLPRILFSGAQLVHATMKEGQPAVSGSPETTIFSRLFQPHILDRLDAALADLLLVPLKAVQQTPSAGFDGLTVGIQVIAAFIGHVAQCIDRPLELHGGVVERKLAAV